MAGAEVYALVAHARTGSLRVVEGAEVHAGQQLAEVGHSGNSTAPHLHFQLMDAPDPLAARGLPCAFHGYEALQGERWAAVAAGMPGKRERVRSCAA
jgi:murein DD-endopeptidase MepM/ murein hydrolase activator NlpD